MLVLKTLMWIALAGAPEDGLKVASGIVESADVAAGVAVVRTPAGPVTFLIQGAKGSELLARDRAVTVRYAVNDGARVVEISPAQPYASLPVAEPAPLTDENLKSAAGTVVTIFAGGTRLQVLTPAGLVTFQTTPGNTKGLSPGEEIRVWYFVWFGAMADRIDVLAPPSSKPKAISQR